MKLLFLLLFASCTTYTVQEKPTPPAPEKPIVMEEIKTAPDGDIVVKITPQNKPSVSEILSAFPGCTKKYWKDRGHMGTGLYEGIINSYVNQLKKKTEVAPLANPNNDALSYYGLPANLETTYAFLIGLSARESSGFYGVGRDTTATNVKSENAESGLFQFSYDIYYGKGPLEPIFEFYKKHPENCDLETFKKGYEKKTPNPKYWGTGVGLEFQRLARTCPAFSTEFTALAVRLNRRHFGPINRRELTYEKACEEMFLRIKEELNENT